MCVWLDLSCFVGIEKHLEISGDAYVSLLHSSANKAPWKLLELGEVLFQRFFYSFF